MIRFRRDILDDQSYSRPVHIDLHEPIDRRSRSRSEGWDGNGGLREHRRTGTSRRRTRLFAPLDRGTPRLRRQDRQYEPRSVDGVSRRRDDGHPDRLRDGTAQSLQPVRRGRILRRSRRARTRPDRSRSRSGNRQPRLRSRPPEKPEPPTAGGRSRRGDRGGRRSSLRWVRGRPLVQRPRRSALTRQRFRRLGAWIQPVECGDRRRTGIAILLRGIHQAEAPGSGARGIPRAPRTLPVRCRSRRSEGSTRGERHLRGDGPRGGSASRGRRGPGTKRSNERANSS